MSIEYKNQEELAIEYANKNNKIVIYEYKDFYCQNTLYDNFGFFESIDFIQLCEVIFNYLKNNNYLKNKYILSDIIEFDSFFQEKDFEFILCENGYHIKIINCCQNSNLTFNDNDELFITTMNTLLNNSSLSLNS